MMSNTTPIKLREPRRHHVRWVSLRKWCEWRRRFKTKDFRPDWVDYDHCDRLRGKDPTYWMDLCRRDKHCCPRVNGGMRCRVDWFDEYDDSWVGVSLCEGSVTLFSMPI